MLDKEKIREIVQNLDRKLLLLETMDDFSIRKSTIDDILYNELYQLKKVCEIYSRREMKDAKRGLSKNTRA